MDYTLAKELKDAGFPQYGSQYILPSGNIVGDMYQGNDQKDGALLPTLEELIEACPRAIDDDEHIGYFTMLALPDGRWIAGYRDAEAFVRSEIDATAIEAVARLWLALHMKDITTKSE